VRFFYALIVLGQSLQHPIGNQNRKGECARRKTTARGRVGAACDGSGFSFLETFLDGKCISQFLVRDLFKSQFHKEQGVDCRPVKDFELEIEPRKTKLASFVGKRDAELPTAQEFVFRFLHPTNQVVQAQSSKSIEIALANGDASLLLA
jgi:hypothetical protein